MTRLCPPDPDRVTVRASDLIGDTPLFELTRLGNGSRLLLKLEPFNPTGSAKVRMARAMIMAAEREGRLKPGGMIVEPTSGNTGAGLALLALERGYSFTAVVDSHASPDKLRMMVALGARLVHAPACTNGPSTVERRRIAAEIVAETGAFWPDQHHNPNNNLGYDALATELLADLGDFAALFGAVGTGGSLCGTARALRQRGCHARIIGVEPRGSIIFGGPPGHYYQTGAGAPHGFTVGPNVDHSLIDEGLTVDDSTAFTTARVVARRCGLLVGGTAGAALSPALKRLPTFPAGSTVVVLVCDGGEKYLDTFYDDDWLRRKNLFDEAAHWRLHRLFDAYSHSVRLAAQDKRKKPA